MIGWIISAVLSILLFAFIYITGIAFCNISEGMYNLCIKAGVDPEPVLKKYGLKKENKCKLKK